MVKLPAPRAILNADGENMAVRSFLSFYTTHNPISIGMMLAEMSQAGWPGYWPEWAATASYQQPLTRAQAERWIRLLFAMEQPPSTQRRAFDRADVERLCEGELPKIDPALFEPLPIVLPSLDLADAAVAKT